MKDETLYRIKIIPGGKPVPYNTNPKRLFKQKEPALALMSTLRRRGVRCELYEGFISYRCIDAGTPEGMEPLF